MSRRKIQKVLEVKGLTKDQINISFQKSRDVLEVENTKLDPAVRTFERTLDEFNKRHQEGPIHTQELDFFYTYLSYLNEQIEQQKHTVSSRLAEVEQIQKTLVNAHKEKKIFEIFYSRILDEEKRETLKLKQKEIKEKESSLLKEEERLKVLRKDLDERIEKYTNLLKQIETVLKKLEQVQDEKIEHVVKAYEVMPPEEAATRLAVLPELTAVKIIKKMKPKKAGIFMA